MNGISITIMTSVVVQNPVLVYVFYLLLKTMNFANNKHGSHICFRTLNQIDEASF